MRRMRIRVPLKEINVIEPVLKLVQRDVLCRTYHGERYCGVCVRGAQEVRPRRASMYARMADWSMSVENVDEASSRCCNARSKVCVEA